MKSLLVTYHTYSKVYMKLQVRVSQAGPKPDKSAGTAEAYESIDRSMCMNVCMYVCMYVCMTAQRTYVYTYDSE